MQTIVEVSCRCGLKKSITVSTKGYLAWVHGGHIQDCLPDVSADDRELMISGICGPCFDLMFPEENDMWEAQWDPEEEACDCGEGSCIFCVPGF